MRSDIKQILFFAGFGFICCIFVFFVPWGNIDQSNQEQTQQISSDQELFSGDLSQEQVAIPTLSPLSGSLKVQVLSNISLAGLQSFLSGFEDKYQVKIQILTSSKTKAKPDLILSDNPNYTGLSLNLSSPIENYFITGLQEQIKEKNLIPFGIDPLVVYTHKKSGLSGSFLAREANRTPKSASSAFFAPRMQQSSFGPSISLNSNAIELLIWEYEQTNNFGAFQDLISEMLDPNLASKLLTFISQQPNCKSQPITCMIERGLLAVGFAFRSQIAQNPHLISDFFPSGVENRYFKTYFFAIPSDSPHPDWARMILLAYLQLENDKLKELADTSSLTSPFIELFQEQENSFTPQFIDQLNYHPSAKKSQLLKRIIEKKLKPDLYFDQAFVY